MFVKCSEESDNHNITGVDPWLHLMILILCFNAVCRHETPGS
jgi:hypothetical protein